MQVFDLIRTVLDEAYADIEGGDAQKDKEINQQLDLLSKRYSRLTDEALKPISYGDPSVRFAYLYRYVTAHANLVYTRIESSQTLSELFDRPELKISSIGGGPGSDLLGILKYCLVNQKNPKLRCTMLDGDPAWNESWTDVDEKVGNALSLSTSFVQVDVTKPDTWKNYGKYFGSDLFTLVYFMSEVYRFRTSASEYFEALFSRPKSGSLLLYIDNNSPHFSNWFDEMAAQHDWKKVRGGDETVGMPFDEEKSSLGYYYGKFGHPKLGSNISYRVIRKS